MNRIAIVSVHANTPLLALMQTMILSQQKHNQDMKFFLLDNHGDQKAQWVYKELIRRKLCQITHVPIADPTFCNGTRILEHGYVLDIFFKTFQWDEFDQVIIMDSDCFFTSTHSLQTLSFEIGLYGASGAIYPGRVFYGQCEPVIHICLMGATSEKLWEAIQHYKTFKQIAFDQIPPDIKPNFTSFADTGRVIGFAITPNDAKDTACQYFHSWGMTRSFSSFDKDQSQFGLKEDVWFGRWSHKVLNTMRSIYDTFHCEPLAQQLKMQFPKSIQACRLNQNPWH